MICPNKNLKEWKELESAVPDMAYVIWDLNDGNGIDRAPNGAPSILFNTLLELTGDRDLAIKLKANTYRIAFRNWFGDWIHNPEASSKAVDENGEPLVLFHGGAKNIDAFRLSTEELSSTGFGYYTDPKTKKQIPMDSNRTMFFSSEIGVAQSYRFLIGVDIGYRLKNIVNRLIAYYDRNSKVSISTTMYYTNTIKEALLKFYKDLEYLSYFNPRFKKFKDYLMNLLQQNKKLSEREQKAFIDMLREVSKETDDFNYPHDMNFAEWIHILPKSHKLLERYNNPEGIKRLLNGEIPLEMLYEWELYKKIRQQRKKQGLPEIANYLEVHASLSHGERFYFFYDGNRLKIWDNNWLDYFVTDSNEKLLSDFINRALLSNEKAQKELANNPKIKFFNSQTELYPVYLNMRNPLLHDYEGTHQGQGYKQSLKYPFGYVAARLVDKAINDGNDSVIYLNIYDPYLADNYGVFNPNLIKSIYNVGSFSTMDDRIRYSIPLKDIVYSDLDDITSSTYLERFRDFLDRLNIEVVENQTEKNILDLSRKILYLTETDDKSLALLQAQIAYRLLDEDTRNKLDELFLYDKKNKRYAKRHNITKWSGVENQRIIKDIADAILGKQNEVSNNKSLFNKIKNILFDLLSKIFKNQAIYKNTIERIASEVTDRYSSYYNQNVAENTEIKKINVDLFKQSEYYPVYEAMINAGASLAGSAGIRLQGALYRKGEETFHDLDFTKDYDSFSWLVRIKIQNMWNEYWDYLRQLFDVPAQVERLSKNMFPKRARNDAYTYAKSRLLNLVLEEFKKTGMYALLSQTYKDIGIKNAFISNLTGMCVTFTVDGFPVDIFYQDSHPMLELDGLIIDDFSVAFAAKLIMRRDKDVRDIINFKRYVFNNSLNLDLSFTYYNTTVEPQVNVLEIELLDDAVSNILSFLQKRFPTLSVQWIDADQIPAGVRKDANAFVKGGVVYLVKGRVTSETTIEEFLHPFLEALQLDNPTLFNILVAEAKLHYPKLWRQIQATYTDEAGFTENDREHELLAHALSEAVNDRFEDELNKSTFKRLLNGFLAWLNHVLYKFTGKNVVLKKTKLGELVDDIFNPNKELKVKIDDGSIKYNILSASQATIEKARKGIQQRIKSLKHYSNPNIRQIQLMEKLYDDLNKLDSIQGAQELIEYMSHSLQDAYQFLQRPVDEINSKQLVQMKRDYLSFFIPVLQDIKYLIDTTDEFKILPDYDKFSRAVELQLTLANYIVNKFDNLVKAKSKKALLAYGEAAGSPTIQQTVDELDNPIYDLNWFETFVGLNSSAGNEVLRVMTDMLQNEINKTKRETFQDGIRLVNLYNAAVKANPDIDVQRLLQEVDEFNQPTGYFTRSRNWGKFYRDQLKFLDDLAKRLGVSVDKDGNYEFSDNNQKREFVKQRTYWQLKHGVLKYTKQYYDAKFKMSLEAQEALDEVNNAIQLIKNRATIGKHFLANLLSDEENAQLKDLLKQRAVLSSEYKYDGTKKEGEELRIAQEISEFRQAVGENLSWDIDADRFNRDADYMIKKYGANSPEYKAWYEASTEEQYTPDFYERLERLFGSASPKSRALYLKRQRLLAPYKNSNDKETMDNVPDSVRQQIKAIDEELSELRPRITKEEYEEFKNFAEIAKTTKYYEDADAARAEGRYEEWYAANHYEDKSGNIRPISVYTYLKPKNGRYVYRLPNYFYKKVNTDSMWINPEFDNNGPYVQPNKQEYDNSEAWNKIQNNPTIKALYDALIQAMNDSNRRISFFDTIREGRLPQITGRMMAVLARADNKFEALKYLVKDSFMVKDDDTDYVEDYERRNDGSLIKLVPTRFIKQLDNPAMITSDVVGSVILYIEMSRNYQNMSEIQNDLELLMYRLEQITIQTKIGQKQGKNTNLYKKAESLLDMVLYGKRQSQLIINGVNVTKLLDKVYNYISLSNLAYNVWAIGANYVTGQGTLDIEGIAGKYFNTSDLAFAKREFLRHFGTLTANIGNVNHKDKVSMLMLLLQVSRSNKETFDRLDQSRVLRGINQHFWYNGYSAGDFVIKGLLMLAVLHGYKLINGEYMTEEQYVATLADKKAARKHFRALQGTLYDAIDIVNGEVKIVALNASELAVRKALNKAQKKIGVLAARIDGNITDTDRAAVHQNMLTRFLVMHRNFMIVGLQERLKGKQFNYSTGLMEGGVYVDFFGNMCWKVIKEMFSQGKINFIANALATYKLMDSVEQYNVRRTLLDMFNIALWSLAISPLFVALAEGDGDDNWGLQALAYMTMRISFEFRSLYNPLELTNLLNSPSAAVSTLDMFFNMFKLVFPGTYLRENGIFGEVKSGAYKGWPKVLRNIVKMTPAKNVYEFFSTQGIENKRTYLENQLMF